MMAMDYYRFFDELERPRAPGVLFFDGRRYRFVPLPDGGGSGIDAGDGISVAGPTVSVRTALASGTAIASGVVSVALAASSGLELDTTGLRWVPAAGGGLQRLAGGAAVVVDAAKGTGLSAGALAVTLGTDAGLSLTSAGLVANVDGSTLSKAGGTLHALGVPTNFTIGGVTTPSTVNAVSLGELTNGSNVDHLHTHEGLDNTPGTGLSSTWDVNVDAAHATEIVAGAVAVKIASGAPGLAHTSGGITMQLASGSSLALSGTGLAWVADSAGGLWFNGTGAAVKLDGTTLSVSSSGLKVAGVPTNFVIGSVATSSNVTAANLGTLTAGASSDAQSLHTHGDLATSALANGGLTKSVGGAFSANVDATLGTMLSAGGYLGVKLATTPGLQLLASGLAFLPKDATIGVDASGAYVAGVPIQFLINGVATTTNVTAANLGTLTAGVSSDGDPLHTHAGLATTAAASGGLQKSGGAFSVLLPASSGLQTAAGGLSVLLNGATLANGVSGLSVAGVPSLFTVAGVAVSANVTAANLSTLTAGAASDGDPLHTHASLATTASASGGLTKTTGAFSANVAAANGTQITSNTIGIKLATTPGLQLVATGLGVLLATNPGLQIAAGGLSVLLNGSTLSNGASGLSVAGVPSLFTVAGVAVSANVTAANLTALTGGGSTSLHTHALAGSLGGTNAAATVVRLDGSAGKIPAANYLEFDVGATAGLSQVQNTTAAGLHMYIQAQASTFGAGGEARIIGGTGNTGTAASDGLVKLQTRNGSVTMLTCDPQNAMVTVLSTMSTRIGTNLRLPNSTTPATPTAEYVIWGSSGALKGIGTSGTITTIGVAEPHCPTCGLDFAHEWERPGRHLAVCVPCLLDTLGAAGIDIAKFAFINEKEAA